MTSSNKSPYPQILEDLLDDLAYKKGWTFTLEWRDRGQGCEGLTLAILVATTNSYARSVRPRLNVVHFFPVPAAAFNKGSWRRWLFERVLDVERHEAMEFFTLDGVKPYAPNHGLGEDPYVVREVTTEEARNTMFTGEQAPRDG